MLSKPKKGQALPAGRKVNMKGNLMCGDAKLPQDGGEWERKESNNLCKYVKDNAVKR